MDELTSSNIFIEGENLEVLKLLRKSYAGRVKMIYIDPPYNTGNDFVYDDDFTEPLKDYLKRSGQLDGEGRPTTTNKKSDGRFHSKWLSMMYPRLRLARELLMDDGVIFVSIDDNEVHHLRMLMNEVFGEENFIATFGWEKRTTRENRRVFSFNYEHICCYSRTKPQFEESRNLLPLTEEVKRRYSNPDNDPRGPWQSVSLNAQAGHATKSQFYDITTPGGRIIQPPTGRCWIVTKERFMEMTTDNRIWFGEDGNNVPREKAFFSEIATGLTPQTLWTAEEVGTNDDAKKSLNEIFSEQSVFDTPKPKTLINRMLQIATNDSSIVLDFFAGSATTAHAVLDLNKEDGGNRKFILVQMPEKVPADSEAAKAGYATIAEIGKERIRRVIKKIKAEKEKAPSTAGELFAGEGEAAPDLGFKVYKLVQSNFKSWEDYHGEDIARLDELFTQAVTPLVPTWKAVADGLFTEILLLEGYPLHSMVRERPEFTKNCIREVTSDFHEKVLLVCLDDRLDEETVGALVLKDNEAFICLDQAVGDELKSGLADKGLIKTI
ncbi:MAG: site-specific DNA-methyltransferase [Treponema sp.]|nr:site-specific DNA-methyltransferase [Treponema sp.]